MRICAAGIGAMPAAGNFSAEAQRTGELPEILGDVTVLPWNCRETQTLPVMSIIARLRYCFCFTTHHLCGLRRGQTQPSHCAALSEKQCKLIFWCRPCMYMSGL